MPALFVIDTQGREKEIHGDSGLSVMEIIRDHGFADLLALCGGCCSCATCHVFVDEAFLQRLPPMGDDERDLLDFSETKAANSRLSCQIRFTGDLAGLRVSIAPET